MTLPASPGTSPTPRWITRSLIALLALTAALYLYRLDTSGHGNSYYAAAAQAGSTSWKAFFFGSLDGGNLITVDKPPAALWFMALSVRIFGLSSWAILVPQALMGVCTVALLFFTVRRWNGPVAGLLAATTLAVTPVVTLMFRYDNPDALLTLLVVAAAYATVRAVEATKPQWIYLVRALIGMAFLTKLLQAFLVVPAFALTYLIAAPITLKTRVLHLLRAAAAMILVAGSWLAAVGLTPPANRPWIGSTATNSIWDLTIGYNGLGRLTGNEVAGGKQVAGGSGSVLRMFSSRMLVDASWLLIAAVITLIVGLWLTRKSERTDRTRASLIMWGGWLVTCVVIFSGMSGIFHTYYAIELAPAIAALFAIGATIFWRERHRPGVVFAIIVTIGLTTMCAVAAFLVNRGFLTWLMWSILVLGLLCVIGWATPLLTQLPPTYRHRTPRLLAIATIIGCLAAPAAFSLSTASAGRVGSSVSSGPHGTGRNLDNKFDCTRLVPMLTKDGARDAWVAAASRVRIAEGCQLATSLPVMSIGGFYGRDPAPTLHQFITLVDKQKVHYYLEYPGKVSNVAGPASQIQSWVRTYYHGGRIDGINVYDLTAPAEPL